MIVRQFDNLIRMFCGFMNDGQVKKPVGTEKKRDWLVKIVPFIK